MADDPRFTNTQVPFAAFVEVTAGRCKLNGPWTDPEKGNVPSAIRALGTFSTEVEIDRASVCIYATGRYQSNSIALGLISIGNQANGTLRKSRPGVMQICWEDVKGFVYDRFNKWEIEKREHPQWALDGHLLSKAYLENRGNKPGFAASLQLATNSPTKDEIESHCRNQITAG